MHFTSEHFEKWLRRGLTRCGFASSIAKRKDRVAYIEQLEPLGVRTDLALIEAGIDSAGQQGALALVLFPLLRTGEHVVELVRFLSNSARWQVEALEWIDHPREGESMFALRYRTTAGLSMHSMGFAPLGCMPVTRRAPYVAVALWTGGFENPHRKTTTEGEIGVIDCMPVDAEGEAYTKVDLIRFRRHGSTLPC